MYISFYDPPFVLFTSFQFLLSLRVLLLSKELEGTIRKSQVPPSLHIFSFFD
jgi:hypothetical protein